MAKKQHFVLVLNLEKMEELKIQEKTFCWWERNQRPNSVLEHIREFCETLFKKWKQKVKGGKSGEVFQWCQYSKTLSKSSNN